MRFPPTLSETLLAIGSSLTAHLKTAHARRVAMFARTSRVTATGNIINISGVPERLLVGENCVIAGDILVFGHAGRIRIGDLVFVGQGSHIWSSEDLVIGNRVLISHNVEIHDTESHPLDPADRAEQTRQIFSTGHPKIITGIRSAPVRIGDDVWIGFGATIRKGVTIGDRAIIGARAIVDRDVPADGLVKVPGTPIEPRMTL